MTIRRSVGVASVISLAVLGVAPGQANAYQTHPANSWTGTATSASATVPGGVTVTVADTGAITISGRNVAAGSRGMKAGMFTPAIAQNTSFLEFTTQTNACASGVTCDNLGTITVSFSQPVRDPVLHLAGIGASSGSAQSQAQFRLTASTPSGAGLGPAGSGATNLQVTGGNTIAVINKRSNTSCTTTTSGGSTAGCGSVPVVGTVTSLTFRVDQTSDGTGAVSPDAFVLGTSVNEDFGDAPASYDATVAASHVVGDLRLGTREDPDNTTVLNDGTVTPSPNAVAPGTDITTPDNDGVSVPLPPLSMADAGHTYTVPVTVSGGSKASRLCGWIDFNGNGVFDNPTERACANVPAGTTSASLVWTVPANVQPGFTYARFRIGYTASQVETPTGLADSGEVEDYRLVIDSIVIKKTADRAVANPGDKVTYTVTVTNAGPRPTTGVTVTDDLSAVLDDATYNQDATATSGSFAYSAPKLTWTGTVGAGRTITLTYSVTVANPDTGDHQLRNGITTNVGNCQPGSADPHCTTAVNVAGMSIAKKVDHQTVNPGDKVTYTVTVTNIGRTTLTGATFTDDLTGVLDDATYNNDATGTVTYTAPKLTWTGTLAVGATATVTYSVTVKNPDTGDFTLTNAVTSTTPGNNCPTNCTTTTPVAGMKITKNVSPTQGKPGDQVTYTVTVTNIGRTILTGATFTDDLIGVLDDATYNNDGATTAGTVSYTAPKLTWTGNLPIGTTATVTYSVRINSPDTGDHQLINAITSTTPGTNCPSPDCGTTTPVPGIEIVKQASTTQAKPGDRITYTVTVTNTGRTAQLGATFTDDLTGVLDDATYNQDGSATLGGVGYGAPKLTWTGDIPVGGSATITYSVTVSNPDTGDHSLNNVITSTTPGNNCPCTTTTPVAGMRIVKQATPTQIDPNGTVTYTITVTNTGKTILTGATFTDNLTGVLDDATYNNDGTATTGAIAYTAPNLIWTSDLAIGSSATVTYSVLVNKTGDHRLNNTITSTTPGNNCPSPDCTTSTPVSGVQITKTASASTANPGDRITYTVTVTNTGQTTLNATFTDNLTNVLDDATYNNDAPATVTYTAPNLTWTGTLAIGASTTITYSVQVNKPDNGDHKLTNVVTSTTPGNNCGCTTTTPVSGLTITKQADKTKVLPGEKITYTVTVTNTGQTVQTGATFTDDLTQVLDDAGYDNDASATIGTTTYAAPHLTWTGDLPIGASATVTYSVTVYDPDTGDKKLVNRITSTTPGTNCDLNSKDPRCTTQTPSPSLRITKKANTTEANPGGKITYTITVLNNGQLDLTNTTITDDLTQVLDEATYNNDASATTGSITYAAPTLTWTGDLKIGADATITYTVTVHDPITGDHELRNAVSSDTPGSNCPPQSTDPACTNTVLLPGMQITKTATPTHADPGTTVTYTIVVTNTGKTTLTNATFTDNLTNVLDDATYNNDATGTVTYSAPNLTWTGTLSVGASATITYSVKVNNPDTGDHKLTNVVTSTTPGTNCDCTTTTPVSGLTITKKANAATANPGEKVTYTVTVTNTGQTVQTGATFTDDLTKVLGDATYNNDAMATVGTTSYTKPKLTWTGDLPTGSTARITYSVLVNKPDTGDHKLTNAVTSTNPGDNCPPGNTDPRCTTTTSITPPPPVPPTPAPPQPLAFTGVVVYPVVGIGLLLLLLGCAAVRYGRRRSTR